MSRGRVPNALTRKLGARVRSSRQERKWTQAELGDHLGIDRGHVSEIECGKRMITLETLQTVAKGFDLSICLPCSKECRHSGASPGSAREILYLAAAGRTQREPFQKEKALSPIYLLAMAAKASGFCACVFSAASAFVASFL